MASDEGCNDYIKDIKHDIASNMTIAVSSWGEKYDTMSWLDRDTGCKGECTNSPNLTISNIKYTTKTPSPPTPPPPPHHLLQNLTTVVNVPQ